MADQGVSTAGTRKEMDFAAYSDLFGKPLAEVDPDVNFLIDLEEERQARKLILIASESICPQPVREALGSVYTNLYAEGYPHPRMSDEERDWLLDYGRQLAYHRRYADRRYYKGCDYINFAEALAQKRVAELFATESIPARGIYANVQPLSGAAANNACYEAFVEPGDVVMGMSLTHGGHLTHGSESNRSGKRYSIVSYEVSRATERLDYAAIKKIAVEARPKMIIAGYSAYPWSIDWPAFREIADSVPGGAILMADIAHPAGLVAGGVFPNPVGYADAISFTTHKTLCGPRGAVILTTDEEKYGLVKAAVFPGEQGGPHINNIIAKAVAFRIAASPAFRRLMEKVVENAKTLADAFVDLGFRIAYGGTDTHMLLVDLKSVKTCTGQVLTGEIASRLLDLCHITCNKNTILGDTNPAHPTGLRFGTTWVTQRGMGRPEMRRLAEIVHRILTSTSAFSYIEASGDVGRGKLDLGFMREMAREVESLEGSARREIGELPPRTGYPHYVLSDEEGELRGETEARDLRKTDLFQAHLDFGATMGNHWGWTMPAHYEGSGVEAQAARSSAALFDLGNLGILELVGERTDGFLQEVGTGDLIGLKPGGGLRTYLLDVSSRLLDDVMVFRLEDEARGFPRYLVVTNAPNSERVLLWFRGLSDGYTVFDGEDVYRKVQGPVVVNDLKTGDAGERARVALGLRGPKAAEILEALGAPEVTGLDAWTLREAELDGTKALVARTGLGASADGYILFGHPDDAQDLWKAILRVGEPMGLRPAGTAARNQLRAEVGLPAYDGGAERPFGIELYRRDPGNFHLTKPYFVGQEVILREAEISHEKAEYRFETEERPVRPSFLLEEHKKLTNKIISFAGWTMPVWYTGIRDEHRAVREAAGLFDVGHMGILEIRGEGATRFLDLVTSNYIARLRPGESMYGYLLGPDGIPVDDVLVYKLESERYMMVVNAVNAEKDLAWLRAVNSRRFIIDAVHPFVEVDVTPTIRDLKDPESGPDRRIDLALQGPRSLEILQKIAGPGALSRKLGKLRRGAFTRGTLRGIDLILSRTGYTGEEVCFELYVHPDRAAELWRLILEEGKEFGVQPAGLGARDSTRTEAGLPLYGNELAGPFAITPIEAGYGPFVKLHKPYFIGRKAALRGALRREREIARFEITTRGARMAKTGDPVVDAKGQCIGAVTSCAMAGDVQIGMAIVKRSAHREEAKIGIFHLPRKGKAPEEGSKSTLQVGDRVLLHTEARIISRFPEPLRASAREPKE
jgi:glycine cleavage system T protein